MVQRRDSGGGDAGGGGICVFNHWLPTCTHVIGLFVCPGKVRRWYKHFQNSYSKFVHFTLGAQTRAYSTYNVRYLHLRRTSMLVALIPFTRVLIKLTLSDTCSDFIARGRPFSEEVSNSRRHSVRAFIMKLQYPGNRKKSNTLKAELVEVQYFQIRWSLIS